MVLRKLTYEQVQEIRAAREQFDENVLIPSISTLAKRYGVSERAISHIMNYKTYRTKKQYYGKVPD